MSTIREPRCRSCAAPLTRTFVDLGETPLANSYLSEADLQRSEPRYPLHARVCDQCLLVQVDDVVPPEAIFSDYAYFSSVSTSWVEHCRRYAQDASARFGLTPESRVIEVASNDGYLLRHFAGAGIPVLGIEPAANVAEAAIAQGIPTEVRFFGREAAEDLRGRGLAADLLIGNNVLAHVPDLNDFIAGLARLLKPDGVLTMEFPHLKRLIEDVQFDTIYHEHFSYFSFAAAETAFARHGLRMFDVERLPTHGGSLRVYACRADGESRAEGEAVAALRAEEHAAGLDRADGYGGFAKRVQALKAALLAFLETEKAAGRAVVAYGAAAKGNTLLNTCGIDGRLIEYVVDRSPHKQGRYLPGSRLAILPPERVFETRPATLLILPWNIRDEIIKDMAGIREWGGRFAIAVPTLRVLP